MSTNFLRRDFHAFKQFWGGMIFPWKSSLKIALAAWRLAIHYSHMTDILYCCCWSWINNHMYTFVKQRRRRQKLKLIIIFLYLHILSISQLNIWVLSKIFLMIHIAVKLIRHVLTKWHKMIYCISHLDKIEAAVSRRYKNLRR